MAMADKIKQTEEEIESLIKQQKSQGVNEEPEEEDETEEETTDVEETEGELEQEDTDSEDEEDASWKKRYGDLRRHQQKNEKKLKDDIETLKKEIETLKAGTEALEDTPTTTKELQEWKRKYPDIAKIVEELAGTIADERFRDAKLSIEELRMTQKKTRRERAEAEIREAHPDFDKLKEADDFHDWLEEQPEVISNALYKNSDDSRSVIRAIDLYKADMGLDTRSKKKTKEEAAKTTKTKSARTSPDAQSQKGKIKESEVASMSAQEYEKRSEEIDKAIATGNFIYDMTGGAR